MRLLPWLLLASATAVAAPRTLRVDYFHTGNATEERWSLDELVLEPLAFPGNPARPLDETNSGKYLFEVRDRATNKLLYSRGYNSIYGEWETTSEARTLNRTFHESVRFAAPEAPVQLVFKKRDDRTQSFREVWTLLVDPKDVFVDTAPPRPAGQLIELQKRGDPAVKVDLLILGDGYSAADRGKFDRDARRLVEILFSFSPFKERRDDFNVWGLCPPSPESGISRPSTGIHKRTPVRSTYDAFGSERYILTFDNKALREVSSQAPYELIEILANGNTYGGGGIFNLYSTVASDSLWSPYVFVHELGHHIAGLADEYFTSETAYEAAAERIEPWEPNVTALRDPANVKWKAMVSAGTPLPTPWEKPKFEEFERGIQKRRKEIRAARKPESEMDALFLEEQKSETAMLKAEKFHGKVGAFEGANYESKGFYRPQTDCVMFSRDQVPFCAVCQSAITRIIDLYSRQK
jgi:hypothetical protein